MAGEARHINSSVFRTLLISFFMLYFATEATAQVRKLEAGPMPTNNPLKGLVPYARPTPDRFPHSMEFNYLGLARLVVGKNEYDWQPLEELLDDIASRGNQAVIRIYMEYPDKADGIPKYLIDDGLKVYTYLNTNTAPFPPKEVSTPDYEDANLRSMLRNFILQFGKKYDGDARLGYITAGLLGTWGEWHTYPRNDLWASKETQTIVMDAYEKAFDKTPILLRYPAGEDHYDKAQTSNRRFGYHDDSLCWATLETGKKEDNWFFVPALKAAGPQTMNRWKTSPIGGEIRPEVWGRIFDDSNDIAQAQSFAKCASQLHLTWTMDTGMFREAASGPRLENAKREVAKLGYVFYIDQCKFPMTTEATKIDVALHVVNKGLAPMYHAWPLEYGLANAEGKIIQTWSTDTTLVGILPDASGTALQNVIDLTSIKPSNYQLLVRVVNPLPNGKPLQFANVEWESISPGWQTLGAITVK
jgi:hypothetical protein